MSGKIKNVLKVQRLKGLFIFFIRSYVLFLVLLFNSHKYSAKCIKFLISRWKEKKEAAILL